MSGVSTPPVDQNPEGGDPLGSVHAGHGAGTAGAKLLTQGTQSMTPNSTTGLVELKPCPVPWCEGPSWLRYHEIDRDQFPSDWRATVACRKCCYEVATVASSQRRARAEAAERWNTRPATHLESQAAIIAEMEKALGDLVGACHEAPKNGPFDQIDNDGRYYQSADLAEKLENGRRALTKARATA